MILSQSPFLGVIVYLLLEVLFRKFYVYLHRIIFMKTKRRNVSWSLVTGKAVFLLEN